MHSKKIPLALIHNESAGDASHDRTWLVEMLSRAGYDVDYHRYDPSSITAALDGAAELIAVAGGDGTVAQVVARARPDGPPIAILPLGTANNLARALGLGAGIEQLVAGWRRAAVRPFFPIDSEGPWGRRRLVEGLGFGAIEEAIANLPDTIDHGSACRSYADAVMTDDPESLELTIDGKTITERFAVLEIATIPLVGPNLRLAPAADPSDRKFAISLVRDSANERQALAAWILAPRGSAPPPVTLRTATRLTIAGRFQRVRIDGKVRTASEEPDWNLGVPITLAAAAEPLPLLLPG
jgi:diacylglycerol kinase family enzyme